MLQFNFPKWKRGRVVEGNGLENRRVGNCFVSLNLTASAKQRAVMDTIKASVFLKQRRKYVPGKMLPVSIKCDACGGTALSSITNAANNRIVSIACLAAKCRAVFK